MQSKVQRYRDLVHEWKASSLPQRRFCEQHDVKLSTFQYWISKLNRENSEEAQIVELTRLNEEGSADVQLPQLLIGAYRIAVPREFDRGALEQLVEFLEDRGAGA